MDNFLCTDDMSLHTIGHTSEGPPATLRWDTRSQTPERTLLSRASRPAPQTRSVEERKRRGSCLWVAAASRWTALSTDAIPLILSPARASQDAPHPHRRRRRRVQIAWRSTTVSQQTPSWTSSMRRCGCGPPLWEIRRRAPGTAVSATPWGGACSSANRTRPSPTTWRCSPSTRAPRPRRSSSDTRCWSIEPANAVGKQQMGVGQARNRVKNAGDMALVPVPGGVDAAGVDVVGGGAGVVVPQRAGRRGHRSAAHPARPPSRRSSGTPPTTRGCCTRPVHWRRSARPT